MLRVIKNNESFVNLIKILKKQLYGCLGLFLILLFFILFANAISSTKYTLIDLSGFEVATLNNIPDEIKHDLQLIGISTLKLNEGLSKNYFPKKLIEQDLLNKVNLATWDNVQIWTSRGDIKIKGLRYDDAVAFSLPAHNNHYYIYTFGGNFSTPPETENYTLKELDFNRKIEIGIDYTLQKSIDSLTIYFQQYNDSERIESTSWTTSRNKGSHSNSRLIELSPDTETFRVYFRIENENADSEIILNSLKLVCLDRAALIDVKNNFKSLSFVMQLKEIINEPGYIGFTRNVKLKGQRDFDNLYLFVSAESDDIELEYLDFINLKIYFNEILVCSIPLSEIDNPTFIDESISLPDSFTLDSLSFFLGVNELTSEQKKIISDKSLYLKIEYLDIQ